MLCATSLCEAEVNGPLSHETLPPLSSSESKKSATKALATGFALVALTVIAYWPALNCGFIWDDNDYVYDNPQLESLQGLGKIWLDVDASPQYYPLVFTTFWIEHKLWGLQPQGYHAVNVLLHAIAVLLVWQILMEIGCSSFVACIAAAIFAVHPVHVESVAWITERKNVLSGVFYLGALWAYIRFDRLDNTSSGSQQKSTAPWHLYGIALLCFLLALLSKTVAATLPAAILLMIWWLRGNTTRFDLLRLTPFFVLGAAFGLLTSYLEREHVGAVGAEWDFGVLDRLLISGRVLSFYVAKLVWPHPLIFIYPRWEIDSSQLWQYLFPLGIAVVTGGLWLSRKKIGRGALAAWLFFIVTLFPVLGFLNVYPMRYSFVADHFQYLASLGLIVLVVLSLAHIVRKSAPQARWIAIGLAAVLLLVYSGLTWNQIGTYQNLDALWRDTLAKNPQAFLAHNNLGVLLKEQGDLAAANEHFRAAIDLKPDYLPALLNQGDVWRDRGDVEKAAKSFRLAVNYHDDEALAHNALGHALIVLGDLDEAAVHLQRAIELEPTLAPAYNNLGHLSRSQGEMNQARQHYEAALQLDPSLAVAYFNLGNLLKSQNGFEEAILRYSQAIEADPSYGRAHFNLANTLAELGKLDEAIKHYREVIRLDPDFSDGHFALATTLRKRGNDSLALKHLLRAIELKEDNVIALNEAAWHMATHTDSALQDPEQAVHFAEKALELSNEENPVILDTLAVAYAANGQFERAQETAIRALKLAQQSNLPYLTEEIRQHLTLIERSQPIRDR